MKNNRIKKGISLLLVLAFVFALSACGSSKTIIDYGDEAAFEAALNNGDNLEGKTVQFTAGELHPDSAYGYNVWAGEHLNFVSSRNPDIKEGDTVVVKATEIQSVMGSWIISYEKVTNAEIGDSTIFSDGTAASATDTTGLNGANEETAETTDQTTAEVPAVTEASDSSALENAANEETPSEDNDQGTTTVVENAAEETTELPLEIKDYGWYIASSLDDTTYMYFCAMVYNPNESLIAQFPDVTATVRNGDGSIAATGDQMGGIIMPGDTVTLVGMLSITSTVLTDDAQIDFDVTCDYGTDTIIYSDARTTDFDITNISEKTGEYESAITGEITNNSDDDMDMIYLSVIFRKDGEIVYIDNTFIDNVNAGQTKAFQYDGFGDWPEHDTIELSAMPW